MKNHYFLLLILLLSSGIATQLNAQKLTFEIKGMSNDSCMIAYYYGSKQYILGDSGVNQMLRLDKNGKGTYVREDMKPGIYMIVFPPTNNYVEFLFESKDLSLSLDKENPTGTIKTTNSTANQIMFDYNVFINGLKEKRTALNKKREEKLDLNIDEDIAKLDDEYDNYRSILFDKYPDNMFTKIIRANMESQVPASITDETEIFYYYRNHYFDKINFEEEWLIRTPFFDRKINQYVDKMIVQHPDSLIPAVDEIIERAGGNDEMFKYLVVSMVNKFAKSKIMGFDAIYVHIVRTYYLSGRATWADEEQLEKMKKRCEKIENNILGVKAKNFDIVTTLNNKLSLYDIKADYTVLYFMDPDCGHCKKSAEKLIEKRDSIPESTNILAVAFNTDMETLKEVEKENNYFWTCSLPANEDIDMSLRHNYDLYSFPVIFILDKDKKIIAKRIGIDDIIGIIEFKMEKNKEE